MSAGLLGMGSVVAGSSETAGRFIAEVLVDAKEYGGDMDAAAIKAIEHLKATKKGTRPWSPTAQLGRSSR